MHIYIYACVSMAIALSGQAAQGLQALRNHPSRNGVELRLAAWDSQHGRVPKNLGPECCLRIGLRLLP